MKISIPLVHIELLDALKPNEHIILLGHKKLSRFWKDSENDLLDKLKRCTEKGFEVVFEWDALPLESQLDEMINLFQGLKLDHIKAIRAQDLGVIYYLKHSSKHQIEIICESRNHNLEGLKEYKKILGPRLNKMVLSIELTKQKLDLYIKELAVPCEIQALGRILLFFSPRSLLSSLKPELDDTRKQSLYSDDFIEALGNSEESPHKGFELLENSHGTFMFHPKKINLLGFLDDLNDLGLASVRYDMRFENLELQKQVLTHNTYPFDCIKGFFLLNKSNVLFKKLKNHRTQRKDESYIGEVLSHESKKYTALYIKKDRLSVGDELEIHTPDGKIKMHEVKSLRNSSGEDVKHLEKNELALFPYLAGVSVRSQIYKLKKP